MKNTTCKHLIGAIIIIVIIYALFEGSTTSFKFREGAGTNGKCCGESAPEIWGNCSTRVTEDECEGNFGPNKASEPTFGGYQWYSSGEQHPNPCDYPQSQSVWAAKQNGTGTGSKCLPDASGNCNEMCAGAKAKCCNEQVLATWCDTCIEQYCGN